MSFLHSLKWSFLAELASKAITPIVFIVLARLLTPEDFGVMSAAMMVIAFSQIFWEAGMGKALIQRQTDVEDAANVAFWVNLALGILIAGLLFWGARPIALTFFQDERVTAVLQVMTLQVILGALSSVQTALLQKQMGFKKLFWVRLTTVALPGIASIPLAWSGMGYWALVAGTLTGQAVQVFMLWRMSGWRPSWRFHSVVTKEMGRFGVWVGASGLLAWFYTWADSLFVGMYLSGRELGLYRVGNQFVAMIYGLMLSPILPVLYSHFVKFVDKEELARKLEIAVAALAMLCIPLSFIIYACSLLIEELLLGKEWSGVARVISIVALASGLSHVFSANGEAYRAGSKPHYETYPMAVGLFIFLPSYIVSIHYGLTTFLVTRLCLVASFGTMIHILLARRVMNLRAMVYVLHQVIWFLGVVVLYAVNLFHGSSWAVFISGMACGFSFFFYYSVKNRKMISLIIERVGIRARLQV